MRTREWNRVGNLKRGLPIVLSTAMVVFMNDQAPTNALMHDEDAVTCRICGKEYASLIFHLRLKHGISCDEYKSEFDVDYVVCRRIRRETAARNTKKGPVGERAPSPEVLLDALRTLFFVLDKVPTKEEFGGVHSTWDTQALYLYGTWKETLLAAGLTPKEKKWTWKTVLEAIRHCAASGASLAYAEVENSDRGLIRAASAIFGSWKDAVETAGYDYDEIRRCLPPMNDDELRHTLKQWCDVHGGLNHTLLNSTAPALYSKVSKRFKSVAKAAKKLNLPHAPANARWTRAKILREGKRLLKAGKKINDRTLRKNSPALLGAIRREFKVMDAFFEELGVSREEAGATRRWTKEILGEELCAWCDAHGPLNGVKLNGTRRDLYERIHAEGLTLAGVADRYGLEFQPCRRRWSVELLFEELARLERTGVPLKGKSMHEASPGLAKACIRLFGSLSKAVQALNAETEEPKT